jgi:hypothetical protein
VRCDVGVDTLSRTALRANNIARQPASQRCWDDAYSGLNRRQRAIAFWTHICSAAMYFVVKRYFASSLEARRRDRVSDCVVSNHVDRQQYSMLVADRSLDVTAAHPRVTTDPAAPCNGFRFARRNLPHFPRGRQLPHMNGRPSRMPKSLVYQHDTMWPHRQGHSLSGK